MDVFDYNLKEFNWHRKVFFDYTKYLSQVEMEYLMYCMKKVKDSFITKETISSKTYNHRIYPDRVDSSCLGYGFKNLDSEDRNQLTILFKNKISNPSLYLELLEQSRGAGVAWDLEEKDFRIYFYFDSPPVYISQEIEELYAKLCTGDRLVAFTFSEDDSEERKFYYYPLRQHWNDLIEEHSLQKEIDKKLCGVAIHLAFAVSNKLVPRFQFDIDPKKQKEILEIVDNVQLTRIWKMYEPFDGVIDTISIHKKCIAAYFL